MAVSRSCGNTIRKLFAAPARAVLASLLLVLALLTMRGAQAVDLSEAAHGMLSLAPHVAIIEDPERALRFEDVRSPALADRYVRYPAAESFNFGITESAYWVRLSLENKSEHPAQAMVEIAYSRLGRLDWHEVKVDGDSAGGVRILRTGYARPYAERPHSGRNFVFPVSIEAGGQRTIYLRVESELPVSLPLRLWTREAFQIHERNDYIVQAAFFGMVLALAAFNLLLYIGLRDGNYVIYLAYALPVSLAISAINGLGAEFLWPDSPRWITISFSVLVHVSSLSLVLFMRRMIGMGAVSPRLDRAMAAVMWLNAGAAVVALLSYQIKLTLLVAFVTAVAILVGSGSCAKAGSRAARIFLLAFLALGLAMLVTSLRVAGLIADTVSTPFRQVLPWKWYCWPLPWSIGFRCCAPRRSRRRRAPWPPSVRWLNHCGNRSANLRCACTSAPPS